MISFTRLATLFFVLVTPIAVITASADRSGVGRASSDTCTITGGGLPFPHPTAEPNFGAAGGNAPAFCEEAIKAVAEPECAVPKSDALKALEEAAASLDKIAKAIEAVGYVYNHLITEVNKFKNVVEELKKKVVDSIDSFTETFTEISDKPLASFVVWVTVGTTVMAVIIAFLSLVLQYIKDFYTSTNKTDEDDKGKDTSEKREDVKGKAMLEKVVEAFNQLSDEDKVLFLACPRYVNPPKENKLSGLVNNDATDQENDKGIFPVITTISSSDLDDVANGVANTKKDASSK